MRSILCPWFRRSLTVVACCCRSCRNGHLHRCCYDVHHRISAIFLQVSRIAQIGQRCSRARMLFFICLCLAPRERRHWRARARWIEGQILAISTLIEARNCAFFSRSRCSLFYRAPAHYLREMSASDKLIHITSNDNESPNILKRHRNFAEVCDFF